MSTIYDSNCLTLGLLLITCFSLFGCSQSGGFYVVPEHKDLGTIDDDSRTASVEFEIFNETSRPVKIKHIFPSCRCTSVELVDNPIPAGKSTIMRATADFSKQAGKQQFSVAFTTDLPAFPTKQVSFEALIPASGTRRRLLSIGSFYPGAEIDRVLPTTSFSKWSVMPAEGSSDDTLKIATDLIPDLVGGTSLVVKGSAPRTVGTFSRTLRFRESIAGEPTLGEGVVELVLTGNVIARWGAPLEFYAGFISLDKDKGVISFTLNGNSASTPMLRSKIVDSVSATFSEEWISLERQLVSSERIDLQFKVDRDKLKQFGPVQTQAELTINYKDGDGESYSTKIFAHIDR